MQFISDYSQFHGNITLYLDPINADLQFFKWGLYIIDVTAPVTYYVYIANKVICNLDITCITTELQ